MGAKVKTDQAMRLDIDALEPWLTNKLKNKYEMREWSRNIKIKPMYIIMYHSRMLPTVMIQLGRG